MIVSTQSSVTFWQTSDSLTIQLLSFDNKNDDCNDNDNNNLLYENDNNNDYRLNQRVCMFCVAQGSCVLKAFSVKC